MNYYEHHLGDWAKDTVHLTMLEEGAYRRLVDVYYIKERPLPKALREVYKLARASAKPEREAVDAVLREFFQEHDDGWHHKRCDEELARYAESQEDAEGKRENDKERQRRARERRRVLFEQLREHGIVPAWDTKTSELETQLSRVTASTGHTTSHVDVTQPVTRDNTANQYPVPSHQSPEVNSMHLLAEVGDPPAGGPPAAPANGRAVNGNGAIPPCDHEAVLALWREHLPVNPQPAKWTEPRRKHLQARWRELFAEGKVHTREEALAWFAKFFRFLAKSEFLTGRVKPRDAGRPPFLAELPWVVRPENFVQCIEGRYHQQEH